MGSTLVSQLAPQAPMLIAYLVAIVLAIMFWQRCPTPSLLTLIAAGLLLGTSVAQTFLFAYLMHAQDGMALGNASRGSIFGLVGFASGIVRALAFGLLLFAVFSGRKRVESPWTE